MIESRSSVTFTILCLIKLFQDTILFFGCILFDLLLHDYLYAYLRSVASTMEPFFDRMSQLLEQPIAWNKYDWNQFLSPTEFKWKYGETPFSNLQVVLFMGVFYLSSVALLQVF